LLCGDEKSTLVLELVVSEVLACPMRISIPDVLPDVTVAWTMTTRLC
jgi:hypothetical protein